MSGGDKPALFPIYVRIVPKDVWLRIHVAPGQTVASIKDAALVHARVPEHDATHSVRFYLDAVDAAAHAKLAASNPQSIKQRNHSLPTVFTTPIPAADLKNGTAFPSPRQNFISLPHRSALAALTSHWSPSKTNNSDKRNAKNNSELYQPLASSSAQRRSQQNQSAMGASTSVTSLATTDSDPAVAARQPDLNAHTATSPNRSEGATSGSAMTTARGRSAHHGHRPSYARSETNSVVRSGSPPLAPTTADPYRHSEPAPSILSHDELRSNASSSENLLLPAHRQSAYTVEEEALADLDSSSSRNRSRTVTAADAQIDPTATVRPRDRPPRPLVAETEQRRSVSHELFQLFADPESVRVRADKSVDSNPPISPSRPAHEDMGKQWSERGRFTVEDMAHPLSKRYALLSATTGCVLEDWKSAAACKLRPFDMVQLQWFVPTERVYTSCFTNDMITEAYIGPHPDTDLLEPYYEGWVHVLEDGQGKSAKSAGAAARLSLAVWSLRWISIRGWRIDMYRQRPRAGEISLPPSDTIWPLMALQQIQVSESPIASNAFLPALETLYGSSISVSFSPLSVSVNGETSLTASASGFTLRCLTRYEHDALYKLLCRAQTRVLWRSTRGSGTDEEAQLNQNVDAWRRRALFRALLASRGATVHSDRSTRNAKVRARIQPSSWPAVWTDADQWSSDSEEEPGYV